MSGCGNLQTNAYFASGAASHDSGESTGPHAAQEFSIAMYFHARRRPLINMTENPRPPGRRAAL